MTNIKPREPHPEHISFPPHHCEPNPELGDDSSQAFILYFNHIYTCICIVCLMTYLRMSDSATENKRNEY